VSRAPWIRFGHADCGFSTLGKRVELAFYVVDGSRIGARTRELRTYRGAGIAAPQMARFELEHFSIRLAVP
jgi:hypothetical protein